jgi:glycogen debranching enzyme
LYADGNGLCEYLHPYSSGLDDSPLWDDGLPVESPDLNAYLCLQYDYLAKIAEVIGESNDARTWAAEAERLAQRLIDVMWDEQAGIFRATRNGVQVNVSTPFHLFPLITGRMPARIADRLVAHLTNPVQFWTRFPAPTVARDDPKHDPLTMWRGPTWVNVNYLLIDGLLRAGYSDVAAELRRRTIDMVMSQPDICEYYHSETGEKPPVAVGLFGWSAALFVDLVLQIGRKTGRTDEDKPE